MNPTKPLLIYTHGAGRLGNQLFAYAHFVAFLEEYAGEFDFINFAFIPYARLLEQTKSQLKCTYPTVHHRLSILNAFVPMIEAKASSGFTPFLQAKLMVNGTRLLHAYGAVSPKAQSILVRDIYDWSFIAGDRMDGLDLAEPDTVNLLRQKNLTILAGWGIRSWSLLEKHGTAVRAALGFDAQYEAIARTFMQSLRQQYDFVIGVVIRQGDYRTSGEVFQRFLFETDQYVRWMHQAAQAFAHKGTVGFVVASDEDQDLAQFKGLNVHFATGKAVGTGHYVENLVEVALCDAVMTPATTFGAWAAFWGNIPIIPLYDAQQSIEPETLQPYFAVFQQFDAMGNKFV